MWVPSLSWEDPLEGGWQLTPIFLPGEFHGQRSLVGIKSQRVRHDWSDSSQNSTARVRETKSLRYSTMDWKTKERPLFTNGELSESSDKKLCLKEKCVCYRRWTCRGTWEPWCRGVTGRWYSPIDWTWSHAILWADAEVTGAVMGELSEPERNSEGKSRELRSKDNE